MAKIFFGINFREISDFVFGFELYKINGYMYAFVGITVCYVVGYLASWILPAQKKSLSGLTLWNPVVES